MNIQPVRQHNESQVGFNGLKTFDKHIHVGSGYGDWGLSTATQPIYEDIPTNVTFDNKLLDAVLKRLTGHKVETSQVGNKLIGLDYNPSEPHKACNLWFDKGNGSYSAVINGRSGNMTQGSYNQMVVRFYKDNTAPSVLARLVEIFGNK